MPRLQFLGILIALMLAALPAGADPLDDAARALTSGRPVEALRLLEALSDQDVDDPIQLRFLRGLALMASSRPVDAIAVLRPVVARFPALTRIRLELARAYFEAGQDEQAERQFRQVLGGDLPPAVRQNVLAILDQIQRRAKWSGSLRAAIAPDTNVSSGTDDEAITLFGQRFELDERARRSAGIGIEAAASLRRKFGKPSDRYRPELSGTLFMREYSNDDFDDYNLSLGGGMERRIRLGSVYAGPRVVRRWFGGAPLSETYGGELRAQRRLTSRTLGFGSAFAGRRRDLRDASNREDAELANVFLGLARPLTSRITLSGGLGLRREAAAEAFDSHTRLDARATLSAEFRGGFRITLAPGAAVEFHDARNPLFSERENKRTYRAALSVSNRLISFLGLSPAVTLQLTRQYSEVGLFDYDRARLLIGVESTF